MSPPVLCQIDDGIATLTLNRPEKLNALNYATIDALLTALDAIERDPSVAAVVLTGAGTRAFSAGADIYEFSQSAARSGEEALREFVRRGQTLTARLESYIKPIVVAVNGLAFGGGCEVTEAAHLAIACEAAEFAKPEILLGMPPTFGGTQRLPRLAGRKRALELLLTGDRFSAARALELGLVNKVVAADELMPAAQEMARRIARHSPAAIASIIRAVTQGINLGIADGLLVERDQFAQVVPGREFHAAVAAWKNRRGPAAPRRPQPEH